MSYILKSKDKDNDIADQRGRVKFSYIKKKGKHKRAKTSSKDK